MTATPTHGITLQPVLVVAHDHEAGVDRRYMVATGTRVILDSAPTMPRPDFLGGGWYATICDPATGGTGRGVVRVEGCRPNG